MSRFCYSHSPDSAPWLRPTASRPERWDLATCTTSGLGSLSASVKAGVDQRRFSLALPLADDLQVLRGISDGHERGGDLRLDRPI